jgi:ankyrin repeat protein
MALSRGHIKVAKLFFKKGVDITVININRLTLLILASANRHIKVVKLLFKKGADVIVLNNNK